MITLTKDKYYHPLNDRLPRRKYERNNKVVITVIEKTDAVACRNDSRLLIMEDTDYGKIVWERKQSHERKKIRSGKFGA